MDILSKFPALVTNLSDETIPGTIQEAWESPKWRRAIMEEMQALLKNRYLGDCSETKRQDAPWLQVGVYSQV